jgi:hypothetical protein
MAKPSYDRARMRRFLNEVWQQNPLLEILRRINVAAAHGEMSREALHRQLVDVLDYFERDSRIAVQVVAEGLVQAARGAGNLASLRSRPGYLQIERQVFQDTDVLLAEVNHEIAYHYARRDGDVPNLGEGPIDAIVLLEGFISGSAFEF